DALPRSQARRPLVPARAALDRGLGGRQGAQGRARGDARGRAPVGAAARAQAPRARFALSVAGIGAWPNPGKSVAIIGGGPAGLMAAEAASNAGARVDVYDAMPSAGRKFLMAGKGGLNLTHSEPPEAFLSRYGARRAYLEPLLSGFGPEALRAWARGLGVETFVGSSGRGVPSDRKPFSPATARAAHPSSPCSPASGLKPCARGRADSASRPSSAAPAACSP